MEVGEDQAKNLKNAISEVIAAFVRETGAVPVINIDITTIGEIGDISDCAMWGVQVGPYYRSTY